MISFVFLFQLISKNLCLQKLLYRSSSCTDLAAIGLSPEAAAYAAAAFGSHMFRVFSKSAARCSGFELMTM